MEEDEIDSEVLIADLHRVLGANETEVASEFRYEATEVLQECAVQVGFGVAGRQPEELEAVRVLELERRGRVRLLHCC